MERSKYINLQPKKYNQFVQNKMLRPVSAIVFDEKSIVFDNYELIIEDPETCLRIGEAVYLQSSLGNRVFLEYKNDVDAYEAFKKAEKVRIEKERIEKKRLESELFWKSYKFPFKFSLEIKEVLSGLSENSSCNGFNKATVLHLYLHENFNSGRFARAEKTFLCSESKSKSGANWGGILGEYSFKEDIYGIPNIVNCKQCLKLMKRFEV